APPAGGAAVSRAPGWQSGLSCSLPLLAFYITQEVVHRIQVFRNHFLVLDANGKVFFEKENHFHHAGGIDNATFQERGIIRQRTGVVGKQVILQNIAPDGVTMAHLTTPYAAAPIASALPSINCWCHNCVLTTAVSAIWSRAAGNLPASALRCNNATRAGSK